MTALMRALGEEGLVREMAERIFGRVSAVFWSGDSFKVKRGGQQCAKYRAEGTGLALAVEQDGHLPVCGRVSSGESEQMTVIAIAYSVMRAHDTVRGECV